MKQIIILMMIMFSLSLTAQDSLMFNTLKKLENRVFICKVKDPFIKKTIVINGTSIKKHIDTDKHFINVISDTIISDRFTTGEITGVFEVVDDQIVLKMNNTIEVVKFIEEDHFFIGEYEFKRYLGASYED